MVTRDRDEEGRPRQVRPRDELGRPLPYGAEGVEPVSEDPLPPLETVRFAIEVLDQGRPFSAHEVTEGVKVWRSQALGSTEIAIVGYTAVLLTVVTAWLLTPKRRIQSSACL